MTEAIEVKNPFLVALGERVRVRLVAIDRNGRVLRFEHVDRGEPPVTV